MANTKCALLLTFTTLLVFTACEDSAGITSRRPKITVTPNPLVFDTVPVGIRAEQTITIANEGEIHLELDSVDWIDRGSNDLTLVNVDALPDRLEPDATAKFVVAYTPSSTDSVTAKIGIDSDDPENKKVEVPVEAKRRQGPVLIGCVKSADIPIPLKCESPPRIDFGDVSRGETFSATLVLRSEGTDPVDITGIALGDTTANTFTIETDETSLRLEVGEAHEVVVRYAPTEVLPAAGSIVVTSNDPQNGSLATSLHGSGVEPWLCIEPRSLDFGSVAVGQEKEETVQIKNCGSGDTVRLEKLEILEPAGAFSVITTLDQPIDLPATEGIAFTAKLKIAPTAEGDHVARFRATADKGRATIALAAGSAGCEMTPFPERATISFDGRPRTVTFQSSGGEACELQTLTLADEFAFSAFPTREVFGAVLEPGDVLTVEVAAFAPEQGLETTLTLGYKTAGDDDAPLRNAVATLIADGVIDPGVCTPIVQPSSLRFGAVAPGTERVLGLLTEGHCIDAVTLTAESNAAFTLTTGSRRHLIRFAPTEPGLATGTVIVTFDAEASLDPVELEVSGFAGTTGICVTPEELPFGDTATEATQSFTISACGSEAVTVERLDFTRSDSEFVMVNAPSLPLVLDAGTSQTVSVRYTPLDNGGDTAVIEVGSNDPVRPSIDVRATGGREIVPVSAGRYLYYWRIADGALSDIFRQPLQGNLTREAFAGPSAGNADCAGCHSVSPDGRFVAIADGTFALRFFDSETKTEFIPPVDLSDGMYVSWNPDVETNPPYQLVYSTGSQILKASLFTGPIGNVTDPVGATMPTWGSNGQIAYVQPSADNGNGPPPPGGGPGTGGTLDIMLIPEAGGVATALSGASNNGQGNFYPAFSPNGQWIAFTQSASAQSTIAPADGRIRLVKADNSGTVNDLAAVNGESGASSYPTWARDGTFLSFSSTRVGGQGSWDIYLVGVDPVTGEADAPFPLTEANSTAFDHAAQWSP